MNIMGIDPGSRAAGYAILTVANGTIKAREYGVIKMRATDPLVKRLNDLFSALEEICGDWKPQLVGVERAFLGINVQSALTLGHARGVTLLSVARAGAEIMEFSPSTVKKCVTGSGRATKDQVEFMVRRVLSLPSDQIKDDAFDALAIAYCAAVSKKSL